MKYKSKNLDFLSNDMKINNLCFYGEYYYFASDVKIPEAEEVTDEEFAEAQASVKAAEPTEPEPTQLDRIETAVNAKNEEIAQAAIDNYTLELMEGGLL